MYSCAARGIASTTSIRTSRAAGRSRRSTVSFSNARVQVLRFAETGITAPLAVNGIVRLRADEGQLGAGEEVDVLIEQVQLEQVRRSNRLKAGAVTIAD